MTPEPWHEGGQSLAVMVEIIFVHTVVPNYIQIRDHWGIFSVAHLEVNTSWCQWSSSWQHRQLWYTPHVSVSNMNWIIATAKKLSRKGSSVGGSGAQKSSSTNWTVFCWPKMLILNAGDMCILHILEFRQWALIIAWLRHISKDENVILD